MIGKQNKTLQRRQSRIATISGKQCNDRPQAIQKIVIRSGLRGRQAEQLGKKKKKKSWPRMQLPQNRKD